MKKKEQGITLITLVITIILMIIILGTTLDLGIENLKVKNLNNLYTDIKSLNDKIATYYNEYGTIPLKEKYTGSYEFEIVQNPNDDPDGYYVIDIKKLSNLLLIKDVKWEGNDVYIINTKTHTIYYPQGVNHEGDMYYRLPGEYSIIDLTPPIVNAKYESVEIIEGDSNEMGKYFEILPNGPDTLNIEFIDVSDNNKIVENTNTLTSGTHIIKCIASKHSGVKAEAEIIIVVKVKYYMGVNSNKSTRYKTKPDLGITVCNFEDTKISNTDILYNIEIDNSKFELSIDEGQLINRVLKANSGEEQSDTYTLTFSPKTGASLLEEEIINIMFKAISPYESMEQIQIKYINRAPQIEVALKNNPIRIAKDNSDYLASITNNVTYTLEDGGTEVADIQYKISDDFNINAVGYYSVTYTITATNYETEITEVQIIVCSPENIEFTEAFIYETEYTTLNSQVDGIINISSTQDDPKISIPFDELAYFSPSEYRYVVIGYKSTSSLANVMGIFADAAPTNNDYFVYVYPIVTDGIWREVILDLWSNEKVKNREWVNGIRFDYTNNGNVNMSVDYIKFLKSVDEKQYAYIEDFNADTYNKHSYVNTNIVSCTDSILQLQTTSVDPQIVIQFDETQYVDPKKYRYLHIRYKTTVAANKIECYMVSNPVDQTYSVTSTVNADGNWHTAVIDLSTNQSVFNIGQIQGMRFDPIDKSDAIIEIDYIAITDRCQ